jgi:hypothetical protein
VDWVTYINSCILAGKYRGDCVINIDETNIDFDPSPATTLCRVGQRTVSIRNNGSSARATCLLGVTMSGHKLPPLIIFKGQPGGRISREFTNPAFNYPQDCIYNVQPKAWNEARVFLDWKHRVLAPYAATKEHGVYLLMDEFSVHLKAECVHAIQGLGVEVDYIPAGYTGCLQVMDKGINKPFKQYLKHQSTAWLVDQPANTKPSRVDIANWVHAAWTQVTVPTMTNTWHAIGLRPWEGER